MGVQPPVETVTENDNPEGRTKGGCDSKESNKKENSKTEVRYTFSEKIVGHKKMS